MDPAEELARVQKEREELIRRLEIAKQPPESPASLEAEISRVDQQILYYEAQVLIQQGFPNQETAEKFERIREALEQLDTLRQDSDEWQKAMDLLRDQLPGAGGEQTIQALTEPPQNDLSGHDLQDLGGAADAATGLLLTGAVLAAAGKDLAAEALDKTKDALGEQLDQTMDDMFPDQAKELADMAERHVEAQRDLERQTDAITAKYLDEHPAANEEQRGAQEAALAQQARAAQEALRAQQEAEVQRLMELRLSELQRF